MKANWTLLDKIEKEKEKEIALMKEIERTETEEAVTTQWRDLAKGTKITETEVAEKWKEMLKSESWIQLDWRQKHSDNFNREGGKNSGIFH